MTSHAPTDARKTLDEAIRAYCAATDEEADTDGPVVVTGWVIAASAIRGSFDPDDDKATYITETMSGQPWHSSLGLWMYAADRSRNAPDVDDHA